MLGPNDCIMVVLVTGRKDPLAPLALTRYRAGQCELHAHRGARRCVPAERRNQRDHVWARVGRAAEGVQVCGVAGGGTHRSLQCSGLRRRGKPLMLHGRGRAGSATMHALLDVSPARQSEIPHVNTALSYFEASAPTTEGVDGASEVQAQQQSMQYQLLFFEMGVRIHIPTIKELKGERYRRDRAQGILLESELRFKLTCWV
ncbi:hypothetical protein B0H14DRAFT_2558237 [Mycena olivaceomarginata]|nr:hypothetical protein B0H14DRAFT_2558237 [Mycena olivaceomarginata]